MKRVALDSSYAAIVFNEYPMIVVCKSGCSVAIAPFTSGALAQGNGWMFQKRSPFLPVFNHYFNKIKESATFKRLRRLSNRPEYESNYYFSKPTCETRKGNPIGLYKISSMFAIVIIGAGACFMTYA